MRNNISAVMIVKNEEAVLERCLDSIEGVMPIVIADTGSTDDTVKIAEYYDATIYEHPWADSFSEARNWINEKVTTKWALQIDADEEAIRSTIHTLDKLDDNVSAYLTPIHNPRADGTESLHYFERLFQPKKIHYKWRVHNEVIVEDGDTEKTELAILHHGYGQSDEEMKRKHENTLRLLMLDIDDAGYVLRNVRYLVQALSALQDWEGVIKAAEEHGHIVADAPIISQMVNTTLIHAYGNMNSPEKAIRVGLETIEKNPRCIDALFALAVIYEGVEWWSDAAECYIAYIMARRGMGYRNVQDIMTYNTWGSLPVAFSRLGICLLKQGKKSEALVAFSRADRLGIGHPDEEGMLCNTDQLAALMIQDGLNLTEPHGELTEGGWDGSVGKHETASS